MAGWGNLWPGEFNVEEILLKDNFLVNQKKEEGKSPTNLLVTFYTEDLGAPQKGFSGQNRALLRPPGAQKGPDIRSKCVLTMSLTQAGQWGAVGTKSGPHGPPRTSGAPKRAFWSQNEPFWGP